jgi:hypothetical protein
VLKAAPTFPSTVAGERAGVSHPSRGTSLDAADRYWHGEVLTWIARTVLLAAAGVNDVDRRTVARAAFQHAVEQPRPYHRICVRTWVTCLANVVGNCAIAPHLSGWSWPSGSRSRLLVSPLLSGMGESSPMPRSP